MQAKTSGPSTKGKSKPFSATSLWPYLHLIKLLTQQVSGDERMLLNDEALIRQHFATRPNVCFETLYNRYVGKVYNRCLSLTKDADTALDYTQDFFMRTFDRLDRFQETLPSPPGFTPSSSTIAWTNSKPPGDCPCRV
ncbi:RNA polymerase sigma factor [Spirosoma pulveris]